MATDRLSQLKQFYDEDPGDPFNIYALALEYLKSDEHEALELFRRLLREFPDYIPTYYHAGKLLEKNGLIRDAIAIYESGMDHCRKAGERKALRELQGAFNELTESL